MVYLRRAGHWQCYPFDQIFAKLAGIDGAAVEQFARDTIPQRAIGNATLLFCGETNGVKYSKADKRVHDTFSASGEQFPREDWCLILSMTA